MEKFYCVECGNELNNIVGSKAPNGWNKATGFTHYCIDCQEKYYDKLCQATAPLLAYFYCCIAFNVPFISKYVPVEETFETPWIEYIDRLRVAREPNIEKIIPSFFDGLTDITKIYGDRVSPEEFEQASELEQKGLKKKTKQEIAQQKVWGVGSDKTLYTDADYNELDRIYNAFSAGMAERGTLNVKQEYILRDCARLELAKQKYISAGKIEIAQKINNMIQTNLASENLRKKDEKPMDDVRIDNIVDALERKGFIKEGKLLNYDQLLDKLRGDIPKYSYTRDAADQMLLYIINTTRENDGLSPFSILPDDMHISDRPGEFPEEPNSKEQKAYEKLGLIRQPKAQDENKGVDERNGN